MDRIEINNLFDIYGDLLTTHEKEIFNDYYIDDLSLAEIAENLNISRTAVHNTLKGVVDKLSFYEDKLNIYKKNIKLLELLNINDINIIKKEIKNICN